MKYMKVEIFKIIQSLIMIALTVTVVLSLNHCAGRIEALRVQTKAIATIAEKAATLAEEARNDLNRQIDEYRKTETNCIWGYFKGLMYNLFCSDRHFGSW